MEVVNIFKKCGWLVVLISRVNEENEMEIEVESNTEN
jgi:hypothetical protein